MAQQPLRQLPLDNIEDLPTRQALQWTQDFIKSFDVINAGFKFFQLTFKSNVTAQAVPHNLGFLPSDIIQTSLVGTGTLSFNYKNFTDKNLIITTTGTSTSDPLIVRFLAGRIE